MQSHKWLANLIQIHLMPIQARIAIQHFSPKVFKQRFADAIVLNLRSLVILEMEDGFDGDTHGFQPKEKAQRFVLDFFFVSMCC
jgi:hypothetical protein